MKNYKSVEETVEYGLDTIDPDRKIEVSLKDLMFAYQTKAVMGHLNAKSLTPIPDRLIVPACTPRVHFCGTLRWHHI